MTRALSDLDDLIVAKIADAAGDPAGLQKLMGCLVAGLGLSIAMCADGSARDANDLCESASVGVFEAAASRAMLVALARGRA